MTTKTQQIEREMEIKRMKNSHYEALFLGIKEHPDCPEDMKIYIRIILDEAEPKYDATTFYKKILKIEDRSLILSIWMAMDLSDSDLELLDIPQPATAELLQDKAQGFMYTTYYVGTTPYVVMGNGDDMPLQQAEEYRREILEFGLYIEEDQRMYVVEFPESNIQRDQNGIYTGIQLPDVNPPRVVEKWGAYNAKSDFEKAINVVADYIKFYGYPNQELGDHILNITNGYTPRMIKNGIHLTHEKMKEQLTLAQIQEIHNIMEIPGKPWNSINEKRNIEAIARFLKFCQDNP